MAYGFFVLALTFVASEWAWRNSGPPPRWAFYGIVTVMFLHGLLAR